jgi:dimethylaniline monooxygenase (N-oxide forming)
MYFPIILFTSELTCLSFNQFDALGVPKDSPLRNTHSLLQGVRINDEGVPTDTNFFSLVKAGKIELVAPARVSRFGQDGWSVILEDGRAIKGDAVVLATGFLSSWRDIMDSK